MPTMVRTPVSNGRTRRVRSSSWNATPITSVRSIQPFNMAGSVDHQVGYTNTKASARRTNRAWAATTSSSTGLSVS